MATSGIADVQFKDVADQLKRHGATLKAKEASLRRKLQDEFSQQETIRQRRTFYENLETNIGPNQQKAQSSLASAKEDLCSVSTKVQSLAQTKAALSKELDVVRGKNKVLVAPELDRLNDLVRACQDSTVLSQGSMRKESCRIDELIRFKTTVDTEIMHCQKTTSDLEHKLQALGHEPDLLKAELARRIDDAHAVQAKLDSTSSQKVGIKREIEIQQRRKDAAISQTKEEAVKKRECQSALDVQRTRVDKTKKHHGDAKLQQHDLASTRTEAESTIRKHEKTIQHMKNGLISGNRQLNLARTTLVKKRQQSSKLKATIPQLRGRLKELEQSLVAIQQVKSADDAQLATIKEKVESSLGSLFDEEYHVEEDLEKDYVDSTHAVAQRENEIANRRAEEKKASLHLSLSQETRNSTVRKTEQAERTKNDLEVASRAEELQRLELKKRIKDDQSRIKYFSSLHDKIRAETAQCTKQLSDVKIDRARVDSSVCQLEKGLRELSDKSITNLHDLKNARRQNCRSREVRARKRTESCGKSAETTEAIKDKQRQQSMIETLQCTLRNAEREVGQAKSQVEQGERKVESLESQLRSRYGKLESLRRDLQLIDEDRRQGEHLAQTKEKELERLHLKNEDIRRSSNLINKELATSSELDHQLRMTENQLRRQIAVGKKISLELEDPRNVRVRSDSRGEDPSSDELSAKISILSQILSDRKEMLLSTELETKEAALRIQHLEGRKEKWKSTTKEIFRELNECQARFTQRTRAHTALLGELEMFRSLLAIANKKRGELERDIALRSKLLLNARQDHVQKKEKSRTKQEQSETPHESPNSPNRRPTAYIPMNTEDENVIMVPRPFGAQPFMPTPSGSTMKNSTRRPKPSKLVMSK